MSKSDQDKNKPHKQEGSSETEPTDVPTLSKSEMLESGDEASDEGPNPRGDTAEDNEEPSAGQNEEPSAGQNEEPSANQGQEPSADQGQEPSADLDKEPSAEQNEEPSVSATNAQSEDAGESPGDSPGKVTAAALSNDDPPPKDADTPAGASSGAQQSPASGAAGKSTKAHKGSASGGSGWISVVLFLLLAALAAGGGYWLWQQQQGTSQRLQQLKEEIAGRDRGVTQVRDQVNELEQQTEQLQQTLDSRAQTLTSLEQSQSSVQSTLNEWQEQADQKLDRMGQRLDGQQQRLTNLSTTSREDWMLAEAEYLLKLANQRILLERTPDNAIALLEAADEIINTVSAGMGDPELFAIRDAIARDLTDLRLVDRIDTQGIYLRLQALSDGLEKLPRIPNSSLDNDAAASADEPAGSGTNAGSQAATGEDPARESTDEPDSWYAQIWAEMKAMVGMLEDYIKIEDTTEPLQPLASQQAVEMASLNVRLLIEQAQIALLKEQATIYQRSLEQAEEMVGRFFMDSAPAREMQNALGELRDKTITTELPDISDSLELLHGYIEQLHQLNPSDNGGGAQ